VGPRRSSPTSLPSLPTVRRVPWPCASRAAAGQRHSAAVPARASASRRPPRGPPLRCGWGWTRQPSPAGPRARRGSNRDGASRRPPAEWEQRMWRAPPGVGMRDSSRAQEANLSPPPELPRVSRRTCRKSLAPRPLASTPRASTPLAPRGELGHDGPAHRESVKRGAEERPRVRHGRRDRPGLPGPRLGGRSGRARLGWRPVGWRVGD
jgi:hypothetical protein